MTLPEGSQQDASPLATPANRWFALTEQLSFCGQSLRHQMFQHAESYALNDVQLSLLWACVTAPPPGQSQNELAQRLLISPAHVSGLVEQLRRKKLVRGHRDAADRRRQLWRATESGRATVQAILAAAADWACRLDHQLGAQGLELLLALLVQLAAALEGLPSAAASTAPLNSRPTRGAAA